MEINTNPLNTVECDECGKQWIMKATEIQTQPIEVHGEKLEVTYFLCPHCGKLYLVRIDNSETRRLQAQIELEQKRVAKDKQNGKNPSKRIKKVIRLSDQHKAVCESLRHKYNGTFYQKSAP